MPQPSVHHDGYETNKLLHGYEIDENDKLSLEFLGKIVICYSRNIFQNKIVYTYKQKLKT